MPEFLPPVSSSSTTDYYRPVEVFVAQPPKQRYWLHVVLLLATIFTTLVVGARMEFNFLHNQPFFYTSDDSITSVFPLTWALQGSNILLGIPFSLTLMLILMAHEMGHYLYCRHYGVSATLPFFIPFPSLFGTMGAFIRIRSPIRSRALARSPWSFELVDSLRSTPSFASARFSRSMAAFGWPPSRLIWANEASTTLAVSLSFTEIAFEYAALQTATESARFGSNESALHRRCS